MSKAKDTVNKESSSIRNEIEGITPICDLMKDAAIVIENNEKMEQNRLNRIYSSFYGGLGSEDDFKEYLESQREYYRMLGCEVSDEEWDEYVAEQEAYYDMMQSQYGCYPNDDDEDDDNDIYNRYDYGGYSATSSSDKNKKLRTSKSQKFINGIEVDDNEFEEYNRRHSTRRGGKKHHRNKSLVNKNSDKHNKRVTRYNDDDWWESHTPDDLENSNYTDYQSKFLNEEKQIIFYRNLPDKEDVLIWNNLHEFNEWLQENEIMVNDSDVSSMIYSKEIHCCLSTETMDKILIVERDYGSLAWEATGGDLDMLKDKSNHWNIHNL